jgi:hypothetical protein
MATAAKEFEFLAFLPVGSNKKRWVFCTARRTRPKQCLAAVK